MNTRLARRSRAAAGSQARPATSAPPWRVEVWSVALFGPDGTLQTRELAEAAALPAPFVERVRQQLADAHTCR